MNHERQMRRWMEELIREQCNRCAYCHRLSNLRWSRCRQEPDSPTLDHIVPRSRGGLDAKHNLVMACFECNQAKSNLGNREHPGPTPEAIYEALMPAEALLAELWVEELKRVLQGVAYGSKCPRARSRRLNRVHRYWEYQLVVVEQVSQGWRTKVAQCGLYLLNQAQISCWLPKVHSGA